MARHRPTLVPHENYGYDPWATKQDVRIRCSVCGWAGIDPLSLVEPEEAVFQIITTGSVYQAPAGTPADQLSNFIDKTTETRYVQGAS